MKDNRETIEHDVKVEHFEFISSTKNLRKVVRSRRQRTRNLLLQVEQRQLKMNSCSDLSSCASTSSSFGFTDFAES